MDPQFDNQLSIESIITAPLVAASKANVVMIGGQTRALLENCFSRKPGEDVYHPVMIRMSLTRGFIQPEAASEGAEPVKPFTLIFSVPLLCLIPINNIAVDKVTVDFDMEITSVTQKEARALPGTEPVIDKKSVLLGKIANRPSNVRDSEPTRNVNESSRLKVNINAGPLPLPLGLLTVLEIYSKAIHPSVPAT